MLYQYVALSLTSFFIAEILQRLRIRVFLTFQNLRNAKQNIRKIASKIARKESSAIVIAIGKRTINLHHSKFGWLLAGISVITTNLSLLAVSIGLVVHHWIRERKIF